jgi:hypothetical protein
LSLPSGLFPSGLSIKILYAFFFSPCMSYPSHPPLLGHSNYTWWKVQVMKLLIMQFPPTSCHLNPTGPIYSPQDDVLNTLSQCSSPNVRGQVSHLYKTIGKIILVYILIFMFFYSRWENKRFWTEW